MSTTTPSTLLIDTAQRVRTITLHRPQVRNAMSAQMVQELLQALAQAEADEIGRAHV